MKFRSISDVVASRLCLGCGACAYISPSQSIELRDFFSEGIRPVLKPGGTEEAVCLEVCPAVATDFLLPSAEGRVADDSVFRSDDWGQVVGVWEGYAADEEIRFKGSSGGVLTALGVHCMENEGMSGVLHIGPSHSDPTRSQTRLSTSREELLAAAGSRYAPASVCNGLGLVEAADSPCLVIGKPSEIAALRKVERVKASLAKKVGLTASFFCAESPSTKGTHELISKMGGKPEAVGSLRYRGYGWPGHFAPTLKGASEPIGKIPYADSWAFLQAYRPWSVHIWPDGTGELADISCGDPWYENPDGENPGFSLVVARTERGKRVIENAIKAGVVVLKPAEPWKLVKSQYYLAEKKGATWGRLLAMNLLGMRTPKFFHAHLFSCWWRLSFSEKMKSVFGTAKRILNRKLRRALVLDPNASVPVEFVSTPPRS